jgi:hypothetical protein
VKWPTHAVGLALLIFSGYELFAQAAPPPAAPAEVATKPWAYSLTTDGYVVPKGDSYGSPVFTADHAWLHLEGRYNYENQQTGSLWAGYNFSAGKKLKIDLTPMIGGVFGQTTGFAVGCETTLTYKQLQFTSSNEYVFDTTNRSGSFFYSWPEITYSPTGWFRIGLVAQHTKAYHTRIDTQRGFLVGLSHKNWEFTTYVFDPDLTYPVTVLELGVSF